MIKRQLAADIKKAIEGLRFQTTDIVLSIPQNLNFGDYSTNIALQLAKRKAEENKQSAVEIANEIMKNLGHPEYLERVEVAGGGFINFFIKPESFGEDIRLILESGQNFGTSDVGKGQKIQVEFVSANPTGPLTLANGRGGALGDTLANVLSKLEYKVEREYYVNDTGNQIRILGESVLAALGKIPPAEHHYQGDYIKELAAEVNNPKSDVPELLKALEGFSPMDEDTMAVRLGWVLADYFLRNHIKGVLDRFGIYYDEYYSERSLYDRGLIEKALQMLSEKGVTYEKDGAVWFKSTEFGDEKDRVLITSEDERGRKEPTYFMADIAHHLDVLSRAYWT